MKIQAFNSNIQLQNKNTKQQNNYLNYQISDSIQLSFKGHIDPKYIKKVKRTISLHDADYALNEFKKDPENFIKTLSDYSKELLSKKKFGKNRILQKMTVFLDYVIKNDDSSKANLNIINKHFEPAQIARMTDNALKSYSNYPVYINILKAAKSNISENTKPEDIKFIKNTLNRVKAANYKVDKDSFELGLQIDSRYFYHANNFDPYPILGANAEYTSIYDAPFSKINSDLRNEIIENNEFKIPLAELTQQNHNDSQGLKDAHQTLNEIIDNLKSAKDKDDEDIENSRKILQKLNEALNKSFDEANRKLNDSAKKTDNNEELSLLMRQKFYLSDNLNHLNSK